MKKPTVCDKCPYNNIKQAGKPICLFPFCIWTFKKDDSRAKRAALKANVDSVFPFGRGKSMVSRCPA
jgi:hypothetical protein